MNLNVISNALNHYVPITRNTKRKVKNYLTKQLYLKQDTYTFLLSQTRNNGFNRFDVIIRLLAIDCLYGKNDYGVDLYRKLLKYRRNPAKTADQHLKDFRKLIESVERNGLLNKYPITVNESGRLVDGAHRLACALYFKQGTIKTAKHEIVEPEFGEGFFNEIFSEEELALLIKRKDDLLKMQNIKERLENQYILNKQFFGRGEFYQSFKELLIEGQRPTEERFDIYGLKDILEPEHSVLDIGSNCGFLSLLTAKYVKNVDGVENNDSLVNIGRAAGTWLDRLNCSFEPCNFKTFEPEKKYDVIYSFAVHYWIGMNLEKYAAKLLTLLRKNGKLLFESQNAETVDADFDRKVETISKVGFNKLYEGALKDDGIISRRFAVMEAI